MPESEMKPIGGLYYVRLTIEGMKHSIERALIDHDGSLRKTVEAELKAAVERFDFAAAVKRSVEEVLRTVVAQSLDRAIRDVVSVGSVRAKIEDIVTGLFRQPT